MSDQSFVGTATETVDPGRRDALHQIAIKAAKKAAFALFQAHRTAGSQAKMTLANVSLSATVTIGGQERASQPTVMKKADVIVSVPANEGNTVSKKVEDEAGKQAETLRQQIGASGRQSVTVTVTLSV